MLVTFQNHNTYYKSSNIHNTSFTGVDLLRKCSKTITRKVQQSVGENNKLGYGAEGSVYKIQNTNYCVKIYHNLKYKIFGNWTKQVSDKEKINHIRAKSYKGVIMKYIEGNSLKHKIPDEVYNLPSKSYKKLLLQISDANRGGMYFDHISANIIYNPQKKSLIAIDFYEGSPDDLRCFQPYTQVFECLKSKNPSNNALLGKKLLHIAINEILNPQNTKIYTCREDLSRLINKIRFTQNNQKWENFDNIQKMLTHISILKQRENFGEINKNKLLKQTKILKEMINNTLNN